MFNNPYFKGFREPQQPITQNFQLANNFDFSIILC